MNQKVAMCVYVMQQYADIQPEETDEGLKTDASREEDWNEWVRNQCIF